MFHTILLFQYNLMVPPVLPLLLFISEIFGPAISTVAVGGGATMAVSQLWKHFVAPALLPPIATVLVEGAKEAFKDIIFNPAPVAALVPSFPSIIGQIGFMKFLPRALLPFADVGLVAGLVAAGPSLLSVGALKIGLKMGAGYVYHSVKHGMATKAVLAAIHLVAADRFKANPTTALDPGVFMEYQSPAWFEAIDPTLRVLVQGTFYGGLVLLTLMSVGRGPFRPSVPKPIEPPNIQDIIIEQAGTRMASFDYGLMLLMKYGLPFIGVLVVLAMGYQFYYLQATVNAQTTANSQLSTSLAASTKALTKVEKARNSQGQYIKDKEVSVETITTTKSKTKKP